MKNQIRWSYIALAIAVPLATALALPGPWPRLACPWHHWLGFECPMCGSTRAWLALAGGDWCGAFRFNPIFWLWGFWTGMAYLELWQRALAPQTAPIGTALMQQLARKPTWLGIHALLIVGATVYLNWGL
jgi:hypothetical protein